MAPIDNLADALRGGDAQQASLAGADATTLRSSSLGLVEAVRNAGLAPGESLLVVADQFEELFRYCRRMSAVDGGAEAALFVNILLTAARRPDAPVYVLLTMRSDFLGDCAQFPGLPESLSESQYLIPRLTREQRRQAITEPLRLFGATATPQLVEQLLNDSGEDSGDTAVGADYRGGAPDPLPVLQHALLRTYLAWKSLPQEKTAGLIDLPQYRDAGRTDAALNKHAEHLFAEELDDETQRWAERIFRCLTTMELGRPVRRPTPLPDLYKIVGAKEEDRKKVDALLYLFSRRENSFVRLNKDGSVDISHESLIWKWKRLSGWVADEAASAELYCDIVKDTGGKATWGEPKLSAALVVKNRNGWNADWARQYSQGHFLAVEEFLARSQNAERKRRWLRWFGVAAALAVPILAVVAYYSMLQTRQKEKELEVAEIARLSVARDQEELKKKLSELNAAKGSTQEQRDRIALEKADVEAQLIKSQEESQKLARRAQESSTDLLGSVKALQNQLTAAQRDRDDALKARADEAKKRQDSESKSAQLESKVSSLTSSVDSLTKDLATAHAARASDVSSTPRPIGRSTSPAEASAEPASPHYWKDPVSKLTWTTKENGTDIKQEEAEAYCRSLGLGWRLPKVEELRSVYNAKRTENGFHVNSEIKLTNGAPWSSEKGPTKYPYYFNFVEGGQKNTFGDGYDRHQALCVRP